MLTKYEQETIINYNQEEGTAHCFTRDKALIHKLDDLCLKSTSIIVVREGDGYKEYTFPKKWVKVKMPRQLSDENRQKAAERARRNFGRRKVTDDGRTEEAHGQAEGQKGQ